MLQLTKNIIDKKIVHDLNNSPIQLSSEITLDEGLFIQDIIRNLRPKNTIEIGCAYGISSLFIAEVVAELDGSHTIIDPYQSSSWNSIGLLNLKRVDLDKHVRFVEQLSYLALSDLIKEKSRFQFAFIDGWHTFDYAFVDFFMIDKILDVGGVIVMDDTNWPALDKVCRYVATNLPYKVIGPMPGNYSHKRSLLNKLVRYVPRFKEIFKPELVEPGKELGFYGKRYVAFKKLKEDITDDGTKGRRWDFHKNF